MTDNAPKSPAEPRDGKPYYIDNQCPDCGTALVLYDSLSTNQLEGSEALGVSAIESNEEVWHDEWVCPHCLDGIHLDMPEDALNELSDRAEEHR